MLNRMVASLVLVVMAAIPAAAQDAPDTRAVLQAADAAMGVSGVHSLRYSGHGYVTSPGQAYSSALNDTWPRYDMSYTRTIDYAANSYMDEQTRNQATWPNRGGGGRPTDGDRLIDLVESAPNDVKADVGKEEAEKIKKQLEDVGAKVELK